MKKYYMTARLSALEKFNGGVINLMPDVIIKIVTLIPLIYMWRAIITSGARVDMSLGQMLSYAYTGSLLSELLVVKTAASGWLSEGVLMKLYGRPMSVLGQLAAQTAGGWFPMLVLFSLPMAAAAPLFGVSLIPASPLFFLSLALCVSLGFAIDALFACLTIKLRNMNWIISRVHLAITAVLSGTVIPIRLLPYGIAEVMKYQPFASLGGAPLSIFAGAADVRETILMQVIWNAVLWPVALFAFMKSQEGIVSYGG